MIYGNSGFGIAVEEGGVLEGAVGCMLEADALGLCGLLYVGVCMGYGHLWGRAWVTTGLFLGVFCDGFWSWASVYG